MMNDEQTMNGRGLRVWHIANLPREAFRVDVASVDEAKQVLRALAEFDLYLGDGSDAWTTVGGRRDKMRALTRDLRMEVRVRLIRDYERWLLDRAPGGVPFVYMNAQGLEEWHEDDGEWCEYHDDEDRDICEIMREEEA